MIIPKLNEAVRKGEDRFRGFHLWEAYDPEVRKKNVKQKSGGMTLRDRNQKPYEHRFGNTPIMYGGVQIGMMIARVPWLVPTAFEGVGLALNILPTQRKASTAAEMIKRKALQKSKDSVLHPAVAASKGIGINQSRIIPGKTTRAQRSQMEKEEEEAEA